jgi:hypothetical protein
MMTVKEIASRLVELCRIGKYEDAQSELYNNDAESIEPAGAQGMQSVKGLEAIKEKGRQFQGMVEQIHGGSVSEPIFAGNNFAISIKIDATMKGQGRSNMEEIAVYNVKDGKIIKEEFFF